jgi:phosphoribosyl 1,2-cyclic phosphate phosphodiesterase
MQSSITLYGQQRTLDAVKSRYHYAFSESNGNSSRPNLALAPISPWHPLTIANLTITPIPIKHGSLNILGFRIGNFAYITDASIIDDDVCHALQGVDVLVINALRDEPHPMHLSFAQATNYVDQIGSKRAYFVHLSHDVHHADLAPRLPLHIQPGYDGLMFEVPS